MSSPNLTVARSAVEFARAIRSTHAAVLAEHGLHSGQDLLFMALWDQPGLRLSRLAELLEVEPPTVTRMVARLARSGFIERRPDPDDGRAALIFPTPRSRLLEPSVRRAWDALEESIAEALKGMDSEQLGQLMAAATNRLRDRAR